MTTTAAQGLGTAGAAARTDAVPAQATVQAATVEVAVLPTTSVQPPARTPAALMGLGTKALATAIVVRTCPPGHLKPALDALGGYRQT